MNDLDEVLWPGVQFGEITIKSVWSEHLPSVLGQYELVEEWEEFLLEQTDVAFRESLDELGLVQADAVEPQFGVDIRQMGSNAEDFHAVFLWIGQAVLSGFVGAALNRPLASLYGGIAQRLSGIRRTVRGNDVSVEVIYHTEALVLLCREHARWFHGESTTLKSVSAIEVTISSPPDRTFLVTLESKNAEFEYRVTELGQLTSIKKNGVDQPTPSLTIPETQTEARVPPQEMRPFPTPSDGQLTNDPLVFMSVSEVLYTAESADWEGYSDYRGNPLPSAFRNALHAELEEQSGTPIPIDSLDVVLVDRPPRADGLFPTYFIDLAPVLEYLRTTVPDHLIGAIVVKALEALAPSVRQRFPGKSLPNDALRQQFSPKVLELLCSNYAKTDMGTDEQPKTGRTRFNTRSTGGYDMPIDDSLPMGWIVTVDFAEQRYMFTVDNRANIIGLLVTRGDSSRPITDANLLAPESTKSKPCG